MSILRRANSYLKKNGILKSIKRLFEKIKEKIFKSNYYKREQESYLEWIKNNEPTENELEKEKKTKFKYSPKISVVVPMYNTPKRYFDDIITSLEEQTYTNWELCLGDGSDKDLEYLKESMPKDTRIIYKKLEKNEGISGNSNQTLKFATGDYIALLDHDDTLPKFCLFEVVKAINENMDAEFIYSDEDKLDEEKNIRKDPHFKPDYAIDTLRSYNYICHLSVFKRELLERAGEFRKEYDGSQDYDIILRMTEKAKKIVHIPKILYHWRINENSVASSSTAKPYAYVAAKKAIVASLERCGEKAVVSDSNILGLYKIKYEIEGNPKVSIIILNKDHKKDLKKCVNSIIKNAGYDNYEIIIVENNSEEKKTFEYYEELKQNDKVVIVESKEKKFNYSKLNNLGVSKCKGEYLLFMNNDIEIISKEFLKILVSNAMRKEVGAVGAKLIYKDGTIQHAGIVINFTGVAGHVNAHLSSADIGYMGRTVIKQNFSAVTAALLMVSKIKYESVNGFDETFPIAYNDVDFCLKLLENNLVNVYEPDVVAYHYESKTRGYEDTEEKISRLHNEATRLQKKHQVIFSKQDPYFNINFREDVPDIRINPNKIKGVK